MRSLFGVVAAVMVAATLAFLVLPIAAIFIRVPPGDLYTSDLALDALRVTAWTSLWANVAFLIVGTPAAYLLATRRFPGRAVVITLCELPLVLPPTVAGVGLLVAFGRFGILSDQMAFLGLAIPFTQIAVIMAVAFVAGPYYLRGATAAFDAIDRDCVDAARTLGAGPARVFARIAIPMAMGGLGSSWAIAFARGVGEFGATIIFAGSLQGVTQTLPLAVYAQFQSDFDAALAIGGLLVIFAATVLLLVKLLSAWQTRSRSASRSPGAASA